MLSQIAATDHVVQLENEVVIGVKERVVSLDVAHLHTMSHLTVKEELNGISGL